MEFYLEQQPSVQEKIEFVFSIIRQVERIPKKFHEHIEGSDGLFEIRIEVGSNILECFVVLTKDTLLSFLMGFKRRHKKHLVT
jgi:hypothetical protein